MAPLVAPSVSLVPFVTLVLPLLSMAWLAVASLRTPADQTGMADERGAG